MWKCWRCQAHRACVEFLLSLCVYIYHWIWCLIKFFYSAMMLQLANAVRFYTGNMLFKIPTICFALIQEGKCYLNKQKSRRDSETRWARRGPQIQCCPLPLQGVPMAGDGGAPAGREAPEAVATRTSISPVSTARPQEAAPAAAAAAAAAG